MCSHQTIKWIYWRPWWLTPTTTPRPTAFWSPGTSSTTSPHSTGRGVLCQDSMLHYWPGHASIWHHPIIVFLLLLVFLFPPFNCSLVGYLLHCTRLCPIVMLILSPPPLLFLFYLGYVMYLAKLTRFLSCCAGIPQMTTSLSDCPIVFLHACL